MSRDDADSAAPLANHAALNESQARRVVSTFSYVDSLLNAVLRVIGSGSTPRSEFTREYVDLTETEARLVSSLVATARQRMVATMDHLGLPRPKVDLSARWSAITTFRFADIALSELTLATLRGYGSIDEQAASEVTAVAAELRDVLARGRELLQPREGERLRERLQSLEGPFGEFLRGAEDLSTRVGVVEVRRLIAAAADRASADTIEIGVFGRISSGKSSFINGLAGAPILPVGATPVTAVPLRVTHGDDAMEVHFLDGRRESLDSSTLADFATEAGNPDNRRHVDSILVLTQQVPEGLALLDTPGVGSMSQSGPAQTFAWLPRCDLGIVLVAAGTPLGRDELSLVSGLTAAGISVEVLLSKSDLVPLSEREAALRYVAGEIARLTGSSGVVVRPVSVMGMDRELLERWRTERLVPLVRQRHAAAASARARRVRALLAALNAALADRTTLDRSRIDLHRERAQAEAEIAAAAVELESADGAALAQAAEAVAAAWRDGTSAGSAARLALLDPTTRALRRARAAADSVLGSAEGDGPSETAARVPPMFDAPFLDDPNVPDRPTALDRLLPRARANQRLSALRSRVRDAYGTYANRLRAWGHERLDENFGRVLSTDGGQTGQLAPELKQLARIVEEHFSDVSSEASRSQPEGMDATQTR